MASSSVAWVAALAPFMPWIAGAFIAIGGLITLLGGFKSEAEKVAKANAEITKTFTEQKSRIDAVKSSIDGVKESYETLAETGANAQEILASGDQELIDKYLEYANTVADVAPELIQGYDDQGRAIIDLAGSYDKLTESVREQEQSNYAMMASNVDGFATELATNYKMASNEIDVAVQKQKNLQSQLKSAMKSGDTNKIKDINADLLAVNTTIAEQKQILSDTSALVNANLVQPFFKSNETIIKWNETFKGKTIETQNGLVSLNSSINGVILNTQRLYDLVKAGDAEGISQLFVNAERSMSIEAAGDDADALLQKFFKMPMYMQQTGMALQGVFGDQINVLNDFSEQLDAIISGTQSATEAFDINAESLAKIRVRDLAAQIDELNDEYEGLTAIMSSGASLTMEQSERYGELTEMLEDAKDELENYTEAIDKETEAQLINKEAMEEILEVLEDTPEGYNKILDSMNEMFDESGNLMEEHVDSYRQMYTELIDEDAQWYDTQIASNAEVSKWLQDELGIRAGEFTTYQELLTEAERLGVADRLTLMTTEQQEAVRLKIESDNAKRTSDALATIDQINNAVALGQNTTSVYSAMREAGYSMWQSIMLQGASCADNLVNIWNGFLNAIDGIVYNIKVMFADMWNDIIAGWNSLPSFITDLFGGKAETVTVKKPTKRTTNYKGNTTALLNKYEKQQKITESLEEGLELIEETAEGYEKIKDYAEEYADILREIYGPAAKDEIIALYDIQLEASQGMLDALEPGTDEWKAAKKELDEINAEIGSTTLGLLDLMREKMEAFFELSREALEKDIFGGSLDDVEDAWDRINNQQDKYVTTAEKVNKIGKLQAQIQEEIAKTDDPRKKAQLQKFIDTELKALKEKDKLTEKEVERAEKLYILTLKQQALENQQMTAMMARLVRDEAGNWSYEYVQDVGKVNEAQKELSDALEDLMNSDKENLKDNQEEMLDLYKQYFDDLEKLQDKAMAGEFASPEEFNAAVDALNKGFANQLEQLNKEQESLLQNMTQSSMAYLFDMYKQNGGQLGIFSEQTEGIIGGLVGALQSGNISWTDIIKGNYDLISQQLGITKEEAESAIEEMTNAITEDFNTSNEAIKKDYDDLKKKVEEATTDMKKAFEDYFKGVSDTMNTQKDAINNLNTALGQQKEQINKVTEAVNKEADEIKNKKQV